MHAKFTLSIHWTTRLPIKVSLFETNIQHLHKITLVVNKDISHDVGSIYEIKTDDSPVFYKTMLIHFAHGRETPWARLCRNVFARALRASKVDILIPDIALQAACNFIALHAFPSVAMAFQWRRPINQFSIDCICKSKEKGEEKKINCWGNQIAIVGTAYLLL